METTSTTRDGSIPLSEMKQDANTEIGFNSGPLASELGEPIVASMSQEDLDQIAREVDLERLETYLLSKHSAGVQALKYHWADPRRWAVLLTHPSPELSALHVRRRARLLSIICIIFFIISVVSNAMAYANHEPFPGVRAVHTLLNVCIPIAYALSRLSYWQYGADLITFGTWLLCLVHMCADLSADKEDYHTMSSFYTWLYTPSWMFFAVLFGTPMRVVGLLILDVITLLNMPAFTNTTFGAMPRILLMHASCDMAIALSVIIHARDMLQLNEAPLPENSDEEAMHEAMRKPEGLIARIFYAPSSLLLNRAQRRRSRVLSAMLLYLMLSGGAWAYLHTKLGDIPDEFASALGGWIGCCAVLYVLSRTVFTHYAAILTVIGVYIVPFTVVWSNHSSLEATLPLYLTHSTLAALLATMLLEGWEMMGLGLLFLIPTFFANLAPFPPTSIITILLVACSIITFLDLRDLKRLENVQRQSIAAKHPIWFGDHSNTTSKLLKTPKLAYWVFGVLISSLILLTFISMGSDVSASRAPALQYDVSGLGRTAQENDVSLAAEGVQWTLRVTTDNVVDSSQQYVIISQGSITEYVNPKGLDAGVTTFHFSSANIHGNVQSIGVWLLGGGAQYSQSAQIRSLTLEDLSSQTVYVWPAVDTSSVPMAETSRTTQGRVTADNYELSSGYVQWSPLNAPVIPAGFANSQQMTDLWNTYVSTYGLTNLTPTDFANFVANAKQLLNNNERVTSSTGSLNRYSHLDLSTFQQQRMGLQTPTDQPSASQFNTESFERNPTAEFSVQAIPTSWDWRTMNGVTAIQDQGQCGSCWAFAGSAAMESANLITNGDGTIIGPQEYVDCCTGTGYYSQGCNGGQFTEPFKYGIAAGTCSKATYPYTASQGTCKTAAAGQCTELAKRPLSYAQVSGSSEASVQTAIMTRPVVIGVAADSWNSYTGGVHTDCSGSMNHAVLLIGWGTDATYGDYWLIKNSWNTWWGESGYIRLKRDGACGCYVCQYVYQVAYAASCPAKTGPTYSTGSCPITPAGSSCSSIGCQYGIASGSFTLTCNAGAWSAIGTCNPPPGCAAIGAPAYGTGSCPATAHGGTCTVSCTNGVISGSQTLTCTAGTWSTVQCRGPPCAAKSAPTYGTGSCVQTADGGTCSTITCTYGPSSTTITCTAGAWSSLTCNAPANCAAFSAPPYATAGCGVTAHGGTCNTPCTYGVQSGSTTRTCNNGAWSALTCNSPPGCGAVSTPQYGAGSCAAAAHGATCSPGVSCTYGVQGGGSSTMTCNAGTWTPSVTCIAPQPCAAISAPTWGSGQCPQTAHGGTCAVQTCTFGPSGVQTRTCNNGVWSSLTCTVPANCVGIGAPYDGTGDCPTAAHGATCTQQCYHGVASGSQDRTCYNGVWSSLVCQAPCSALNPPQYGSGWCLTTSEGGSCQQSCLYGAPTSGSTVRTCNGGQWSALQCPTGQSCTALTAPQYGSGACATTVHGSTCTQSCTNGLAVNGGSLTRTCNNGVWSDLQCAATATTNANCAVQWGDWGACQSPCQYDWVLLAKADGTTAINPSFYTAASGSAAGASYSTACSQFDLVTYPNAVLRITMGSIVDYVKAAPGKSVCDILTTSGGFLYSPSLDGPFIAPTYYGSLLGGSAINWPASAYGAANDARSYLSFWGGGPSNLGGCCHDTGTKGQPGAAAAWGKAFAVHLLVLPGTQTRTATITTPPSGSGTSCPALTQTQSCICPVNGGWGAFSGTCPVQCDGGVLARTCNNPAPAYGGAPCPGFDWQYCGSTPCSTTAAMVTVVLDGQKSNMTHDDLPGFEWQISYEISTALHIPSSWIAVLNVDVRSSSTVAVLLSIDNGNSSSEQNNALVNELSDMINDPNSNIHLPQLFPLMASSTVDQPSSGQSWQFYVEVVFGSIAGVLALAAIVYLSVWMWRKHKEEGESEGKWNKLGSPKEDKWDLNNSSSNFNSKPAYDTGGLNTTSYGYTNPVASPQHRSTPSMPNRSPSPPPAAAHRPVNSYGGANSSYSQMQTTTTASRPAPPARTATNTTNSTNGSNSIGATRSPSPPAPRSPSPAPYASSSPPRPLSPVSSNTGARAPPPKPTATRPGSPTGGAAGGRAPPPKPAGANRNAPGNWVKKYDAGHKHYYYWNKVTNVSQWNVPVGFVEN